METVRISTVLCSFNKEKIRKIAGSIVSNIRNLHRCYKNNWNKTTYSNTHPKITNNYHK